MKLSGESKVLLGIAAVTLAIIALGVVIFSRPEKTTILPKEALVTKGSFTKGNPNAQAVLVEFSDFQCPACKAFKPTVDDLMNKHKDTLFFVYRHFPLPQHTFAIPAARAAEAAGAQGKFWEMYDLLFANQEKFSDSLWPDLASKLSLDGKKFNQDFASKATQDTIDRDLSYGTQVGIGSTPTFFLNGKMLRNLTSFDDFRSRVEAEIK